MHQNTSTQSIKMNLNDLFSISDIQGLEYKYVFDTTKNV